jgi:Rab-GTPase-TBC domain
MQEVPRSTLLAIARDVPASVPLMCARGGGCTEVHWHLTRVLRLYAATDPELGYASGLHHLAGCILVYTDTMPAAFTVLRGLLWDQGMRCLYLADQSGAQVHLPRHRLRHATYGWLWPTVLSDLPLGADFQYLVCVHR